MRTLACVSASGGTERLQGYAGMAIHGRPDPKGRNADGLGAAASSVHAADERRASRARLRGQAGRSASKDT